MNLFDLKKLTKLLQVSVEFLAQLHGTYIRHFTNPTDRRAVGSDPALGIIEFASSFLVWQHFSLKLPGISQLVDHKWSDSFIWHTIQISFPGMFLSYIGTIHGCIHQRIFVYVNLFLYTSTAVSRRFLISACTLEWLGVVCSFVWNFLTFSNGIFLIFLNY